MEGREHNEASEGLTPAIQEVLDMPRNLDDYDFHSNYKREPFSLEWSEDALKILIAQAVKEGRRDSIPVAINVLNRESMENSDKKDVFGQAIRDAATKIGYEINMSHRTYGPSGGEIALAEEMMKFIEGKE